MQKTNETQQKIEAPQKQVPQPVMPQPVKTQSVGVDKTRTYLYEKQTEQLANNIFADGIVTKQESVELRANHDEIIRDFLCACDVLDKMEQNPSAYSPESIDAARFVVNRLMRAREKSYAAMDKAAFYNHIPPAEKALREERRQKKEHLDINFNLYQIFALNGNAHEVVNYARKNEKTRVMTPEQALKTEKRIMDLVNQVIEKGQDERQIQQFLKDGLERAN